MRRSGDARRHGEGKKKGVRRRASRPIAFACSQEAPWDQDPKGWHTRMPRGPRLPQTSLPAARSSPGAPRHGRRVAGQRAGAVVAVTHDLRSILPYLYARARARSAIRTAPRRRTMPPGSLSGDLRPGGHAPARTLPALPEGPRSPTMRAFRRSWNRMHRTAFALRSQVTRQALRRDWPPPSVPARAWPRPSRSTRLPARSRRRAARRACPRPGPGRPARRPS